MSNEIRNAAAITAEIDAINAAAEATGSPVDGGLLTLLTLELRAANAVEKFAKAKAEYDAQSAVRDLNPGDAVTFQFGRAATKEVRTGSILAIGESASGLQFNILSGEGINSKTSLVSADAILLTPEAIERVEQEIAEAKAARDAAKDTAE